MKPTTKDILSIRAGRSEAFQCLTAMEMNSARAIVYYVNRCRKPANIARYSLSSDFEHLTVVITAHSANR